MKKSTTKRILAMLMVFAMLLQYTVSVESLVAYADEEGTETVQEEAKEAKPAKTEAAPEKKSEPAKTEAAPEKKSEPAQEKAEPEPEPEKPAKEEVKETPADSPSETPSSGDEAQPSGGGGDSGTADDEAQPGEETDQEDLEEPVDEEELLTEEELLEEEEEEEEVEYPAQDFTGTAGDVQVKVHAPEGALPEGTVMKVKSVSNSSVSGAVKGELGSDAKVIKAVDITFTYEGKEVEPKDGKDLAVRFISSKFNDLNDPAVVHIDDNRNAEKLSDGVVSASGSNVSFKADEFSIYVVVETGEDARLTVNFKNGNSTIASTVVKKTDIESGIFDQIVYDPGVGDLGDNQVFRGWTTVENYTVEGLTNGDNPAMTIDDVRTAVKAKLNSGVTDGESMTFYAMTFKVVNITFKDEDSVVIKNEGLLTKGESVSYTVDEPYTPKTSDQEFQGWFVSSSGTVKDGSGNVIPEGTAIANGTRITATADVILNVKAPAGYWLIFKENAKGASYTSPQFLEGVKPTEPDDPSYFGHTFGGWYTDEACTDGNEFNFDQVLTKTTTVYAKWTENTTARYTVIIWKQKVTDAKDAATKTYDFAESVSLEGTVGQRVNTVSANGTGDDRYAIVNGVSKRYTGFHLGDYDTNVTINSNGTAVVNVYYDRNLVTLTFLYRSNNSWATQITMTGLYGSSLADNDYEWPTNRWWYDDYQVVGWSYSAAGTRTTFLDAFILSNGASSQTFYGFTGTGSRNVYWYKMDEDGNWPALTSPTNSATVGNSGSFAISDKYNGYHVVSYSTNGRNWTTVSSKDSEGYYARVSEYTNLYIRCAPDTYSIEFNDGIYVDGDGNAVEGYSSRGELKVEEDVPFESDISSYNKGGADYYEPTFSGFVFDGWYVDDACTQAYTFDTMPEGLTVYAKWVQKEYRVFLHPNVPTSDSSFSMGGQNTSFRVSNGESVNKINGIRDDYELVGWYTDEACTHAFNFDAYTVNDSTTVPYDQTQPTETDMYGNPTSSENKDAVNNRFWIDRKLDLYAKWRSKLLGANGITVVYDAGDGTFSGGETSYTDPLTYKDSSKAVATTATTPDDEKTEFEYWTVQKWNGSAFVDTETTVYPGDSFEVLKSYTQVTENEGSTEENPSYTYTFKLVATYKPIDEETLSHIYWYANNTTTNKVEDNGVHMNTNVAIKGADTFSYPGYEFIGWARYEEGSSPSSPTDASNLWIEYDKESGTFKHDGATATNIACDEKTPYHDLYAVWKESDVTINYAVASDSTGYEGVSVSPTTETIKAASGTAAGSTASSTTSKYIIDYWTCDNGTDHVGDAAHFTPSKNDSGVYEEHTYYAHFKLNKAEVTVHHYLKGTTTKVAEDQTTEEVIGSEFTATPVTTYQERNLTVDSYNPSQKVTVSEDGNVITIYYTLPLTITAASANKVYDGSALTKNEATPGEGQLLDGDSVASVTVTGSQTLVGSSDNVPSAAVIKKGETTVEYYKITYVNGTLTVTDEPGPGEDPVDPDLVVTKDDAEDEDYKYAEGDTVTFTITATNIYDEPQTITLSEIDGVTLDQSVFEDVPAGETVTTTATYVIKPADMAEGSFTNTVTATLGNISKDAEDTVSTEEIESAIEVTKTSEDSGVKVGETVTYTITVTNTGNATVSNLALNDILPDIQLGALSATTLAPGETATATATYVVKQSDVNKGSIDNKVTATGKDPKSTDVTDDAECTVTTEEGNPDITVTKTANKTSGFKAGDTVTYTITVTNTGNVTASHLAYTDILAGIVPGDLDKTQLAPGESATATATYVVKQTDVDAGEINNSVTVTGKDPKNIDINGTASCRVTTVTAEPELTVTKTADKTKDLKVGDTVTYTITVENTGNVTVSSLTLTDVLAGIQLGTLDKTTIAPGETATATASYVVKQSDVDAGKIENTATATGKDPKNEDVSDDADCTVTTVKAEASIEVTKTAEPASGVGVDDVVTYTITVKNTGNVTVSSLALTDELEGIQLGALDKTTIAPGETATATATYTVKQADVDAGKIENTATATGKDPGNKDVTDDDDCTVTTEEADAELTVEKIADPEGGVGVDDVVTYTITVENTGNVTVSDLELTDVLTDIELGDLDKTTIAPGEIATATATYTVTQADVDAGKIDNTATATGKDPAGEEVTDDASCTVTTEEAEPALTVTKTAAEPTSDLEVDNVVTYTVVVTNSGNVTVSDIAMSDTLVTLSEEAFDLAPNGTKVFEYTYTVKQSDVDAGKIDNTATATGKDPSGEDVTDSDDAEVTTVEAEPELTVTKTSEDSGVKVGETVTYSITVENTGNVTVSELALADELEGVQITTLSAETLAPGETATATATYTVTQADVDAGKIDNTATATGKDPAGEDVSDDATCTVTTEKGAPALTVTKEADKTSGVEVDDTVTYTITVKNTGNVTVSSLALADELEGVEVGALSATTLTPGAEATATATYEVAQKDVDAGQIVNKVTATGKDPDKNDVSGNASCTVTTVTQSASIEVTKTAEPASGVAVGDTVTYTITVENTGNVTVSSLELTDVLAGIQLGALDKTSIAPGETATATATYEVTQADVDAGEIENTATATGKDPKNNNVTDEDDCTVTTVEAEAELTVEKTADPESNVAVGDEVTYTVVVTNSGNVTVSGIAMSDTLVTLNEEAFDLAPEETKTITYTYTVVQADVDAGKIDNTATATGKDPKNNNVTDNDDCTVTTEEAEPELTVEKTADPTSDVEVGDEITYTVVVTNSGNVTVSDIAMSDTLVTLSEEEFDLAPNGTKTITYTYAVTQADVDAGKIDNTATATGEDPSGEEVTASDDAEVTTVEAEPELTVSKTSENSKVKVGETVTYSITVTNSGNVTVSGLALTDELEGVQITTLSATTLAPGATATATATYTVQQKDVDAGQIVNKVTAAGKDPFDEDVTDDATCTVTTEEGKPALTVTKTADKTSGVKVGDTVTYTITVSNTGNVTVSSLELADVLTGIELGALDKTTIGPGEAATATATYTVQQKDVDAGQIVNTATATGKNPKGNEVTGSATCTVTTEAANASIEVTKTASPASGVEVEGTVTFTIAVKNTGNVTVSSLEVTDELEGVELGDLNKTSIAPGETATATATYTVTQADVDAGKIENTATATGKDPKNNTVTDDGDCTVNTVAMDASFEVVKTVTSEGHGEGGTYKANETVTYEIVVENTGNVTLSNITVTDTLTASDPDEAVTFGDMPTGAVKNSDGTISIAKLEVGETIKIPATYTVTQDDVDAQKTISNAVAAKGSNPQDDDEVTPEPPKPADVDPEPADKKFTAVKKVTSTGHGKNGTYKAGETVEYEITVTNTGNVTLSNITVEDKLEASAEDAHVTFGDMPTGAVKNSDGTISIAKLEVKKAIKITATYEVTQEDVDAQKTIKNVLTASGDGVDPDPSEPTVDPEPKDPKFTAVKKVTSTGTGEGGTYKAGDTVDYQITVTNTGNVTLSKIKVEDQLDASDSSAKVKFDDMPEGATLNEKDNSITIDKLDVKDNMVFTAHYTVTQEDVDNQKTISNAVTAKAKDPGDDDIDPPPSNPPTVDPEKENAKISVTKSASATSGLAAGDTVTYTVTVRNTGNVTLNNVSVKDTLVAFSGNSGSIGSLAPGEGRRFTYSYTVTAANVTAGSVVNTASATGTSPKGATPSASATVTATTATPGGGGGGPAPGGGGGPGVVPGGPTPDGTVVPDGPVPEVEPEVDIIDPAPPLAGGAWALINLISAVLTTLGAAIALFRKKEEEDEEDEQEQIDRSENEDEDDNRGKKMLAAKIAGALAGIAAPITFMLTEDMSLPMQLIDKWTILMLVMLTAQIAAAVFNKKASELDDEEEEEAAEGAN